MAFVLDASVATGWFLKEKDDLRTPVAWDLMRTESAAVPSIWWYEVRNALLMAERRKRLTTADVDQTWDELRQLRIEIDARPKDDETRMLARRNVLSFYDAAYLELAIRLNCPLATTDHSLAKAARFERVPLVGESP